MKEKPTLTASKLKKLRTAIRGYQQIEYKHNSNLTDSILNLNVQSCNVPEDF